MIPRPRSGPLRVWPVGISSFENCGSDANVGPSLRLRYACPHMQIPPSSFLSHPTHFPRWAEPTVWGADGGASTLGGEVAVSSSPFSLSKQRYRQTHSCCCDHTAHKLFLDLLRAAWLHLLCASHT